MIVGKALRVARGGRVLLRDVDVEARKGEVLGVLGPSGAGKSTLFGALTGDGGLDSGSVMLGDTDVTHWPLWRRARAGIGYVPQTPSVLLDLTVRQNLETFQAIVRGEVAGVVEAADRVDLGERLDVRAGELSAGERRRLEVARALVAEPRVLICDEPFAGVDPSGAARLGALLREAADGGAAVLLADHHVAEALRLCDRAILLLDGAVAVDASPGEFEAHPLVKGRYLGTWIPGHDTVSSEGNADRTSSSTS